MSPILGRTFSPGEDQPGKNNVVVLSYEVWQQNFGGAKDVIGRVVKLDGSPYTVIGVMPAGFRFPISQRAAIYTPLHMIDLLRNNQGRSLVANDRTVKARRLGGAGQSGHGRRARKCWPGLSGREQRPPHGAAPDCRSHDRKYRRAFAGAALCRAGGAGDRLREPGRTVAGARREAGARSGVAFGDRRVAMRDLCARC